LSSYSRSHFGAVVSSTSALVSIVLPLRNEGGHLATTLDAVFNQTYPSDRTEVLAVNGCSQDNTLQILQEYQKQYPNLRVLDNPRRTTPTSLNMAIAASTGDVIVRVDGHTIIASDYVERCVELLEESDAANVGGPMRPRATGAAGDAIAVGTSSRFGIGNARFHYLHRQQWADTVYMGAFRRKVLTELGGYDEELERNQDDELNYRIRRAGYRILLSPDIVSTYTPRNSLRALWRQYYQYGFWKVRVIEKHPASAQTRHLAPAGLVLGLFSSTVAFVALRRSVLLIPWFLYVAAVVAAAIINARRSFRRAILLMAVFPCLHLSYGIGFMVGLGRAAVRASRGKRS
jgi:succinoglycan biosynthesis protein ExoA